jgi:hypothetical protein
VPLTLPNPILLTPARSSMRLRCGSGEVRMPVPMGPFFWPSPFWPLDDFFWFFFFSKFGFTAPNYSRRPLMRSRPHPIKKIGGNFCPNPPEPTGTGIRTSPEPHRSRIGLRAIVKSIGLGNVIHIVQARRLRMSGIQCSDGCH